MLNPYFAAVVVDDHHLLLFHLFAWTTTTTKNNFAIDHSFMDIWTLFSLSLDCTREHQFGQ